MNFSSLDFKTEGPIGVLSVKRPEALNALNKQVLADLDSALTKLEATTDIRALIITGSGEKAFVAGADIKEMEDINPSQSTEFARRGQSVFSRLENLKIPSIAAVNGFALGGGLELALACDFILASNKAKLGLPEVSLGLIPGYGGTQRLARHCGQQVAKLFVLTGDMFSAEQCLSFGLVTQVVEPQDLMAEAMKRAQSIAKRSPVAVRLAKEAISKGFDLSLKEGLALEAELFQKTFSSNDKTEGVKAFIEKRAPQFKGT